MECRFSQRALSDLRAIGEYIAQDSPGNAKNYVMQLTAHCRKVAQNPKIRKVHAHLKGRPLRKALFKRHRIYYALLADDRGIEIIHIRHGARIEPDFSGQEFTGT